jgi:RNase adapter protein RapZ
MKPADATDAKKAAQDVILVTGPSGAGRTTTIHVLEDLGFETIDNLPLSLLPRLFQGTPLTQPVAVGVDARNRDFSADGVLQAMESLAADPGLDARLLFVDCAPEILLKRYSETRRRHPLAPFDTPLVGIEKEIDLLKPVRERADILIDTSEITPHELRAELGEMFSRQSATSLSVSVHSFSFKRGTPRGLDMVIDCRFLRNPYWDEALRPQTGQDREVAEFVAADPLYDAFFEKLVEFTTLLLPAYKAEGKSYFSIGLGCTGGQHRSVAVAESLSNRLAQAGWQVSIRHRELERLQSAGSSYKGMKQV